MSAIGSAHISAKYATIDATKLSTQCTTFFATKYATEMSANSSTLGATELPAILFADYLAFKSAILTHQPTIDRAHL